VGNFPAVDVSERQRSIEPFLWFILNVGPRLTLGETGSEQTRDLLDQSLGGQESVVLLGELLDELLVLVEPTDEKVGL
jgi:hypothetical protein